MVGHRHFFSIETANAKKKRADQRQKKKNPRKSRPNNILTGRPMGMDQEWGMEERERKTIGLLPNGLVPPCAKTVATP